MSLVYAAETKAAAPCIVFAFSSNLFICKLCDTNTHPQTLPQRNQESNQKWEDRQIKSEGVNGNVSHSSICDPVDQNTS